MLTREQEQEMVRQFENGTWNPSEWEIVQRRVYNVTVSDEQLPILNMRAAERGETVDDYLSALVGAILATA